MLHSATITKPKRNVFAVLDVGTTKMVCFTVRILNTGEPEVIGIGYKVSEGINGGAITNMKHASYSILSSIDIAEQVSEETIDQVYINISGCNILSFNITNEISSTKHEISNRDIRRIMLQTYEKCNESEVVMHNIPIRYSLDDVNNITELRGLFGSKLKADMHVITASKSALLNLEHCVTSCNLNMAGCVAEAYASGLACLTEDEKESGAIIIDIGGNYTSLGVFDKGKLIYTHSLPLGGNHITRDIAYGLSIGIHDAERIKILHGNIILTSADENEIIEINNTEEDDEPIQILKADLIKIIRPRVEEILDIVKEKLDQNKNFTKKVVITGGASKLLSMREIANHVLNRQVRIGCPVNLRGIQGEYSRNPIFSAAIGVTLLIAEAFYKNNDMVTNEDNPLKKILRWMKIKV